MSPADSHAKTYLAEQFAELYRECQERCRSLLEAVLDASVGIQDFDELANVLRAEMLRLKEMKLQIEELKRRGG